MIAEFLPALPAGAAAAPPSKSMAHRLLLAAAMSVGTSMLGNFSFSDDLRATARCLEALGARIAHSGCGVAVTGALKPSDRLVRLPCGESGSTLRFLLPVCLALGGEYAFSGTPRLMERPLDEYERIAEERGIRFEKKKNELFVSGRLCPGEYSVSGEVSSQFVSGLLFALLLPAGESALKVTALKSAPYAEMTLAVLRSFGFDVEKREDNVFLISGGRRGSARNVEVEGDFTAAAYLEAFGLRSGGVSVTGLNEDSLQGDRVYKELFDRLKNGFCEIDLSDNPDLTPILFSAAALLHGGRFTGVGRLKYKESDRVSAMAEALGACGVRVLTEGDAAAVFPDRPHRPARPLSGHNDHRVVMAEAALLAHVGGAIAGAEAVNKSFPGFFQTIAGLGVRMTVGG